MKKLILFFIIFIIANSLGAQTKSAFIRAGDQALKKGDFFTAMHHYEEALEFPGSKIAVHYQLAEAARQFFAYDLAIEHYRQVLSHEKASQYPLSAFWLGQTYQQTGKYEKAIQLLTNFISNTNNVLFKNKAITAKAACQWAMETIANPHEVEITHLDKKINTPFSEFGPLRRGDTLYYSSYRYNPGDDKNIPPRKITKVLTQKGTAKGRPLTRKFNEKDKLTAHSSLTPDGSRIYYTICDYVKDLDIRCEIHYRDLDSRKRWGKAIKLPAPVNQRGTTSTHPNVGKDPITGRPVLYFVSDRPEGTGGLDIYQVELKGDKPGSLKNLSSVNTIEDDITPFYAHSSNTLYFSSKGYQGLGGFDIFQVKKGSAGWENPMHTGYPLNSSYNDVYFSINRDSTQAYISSNRLGSFFLEKENKACCNDIYEVKIFPPKPEPELEPVAEIVADTIPAVPPVAIVPPAPPVEKPLIPVILEDTAAVVVNPPMPPAPPVVIPPSTKPEPTVVVSPVPVSELQNMLPLPLYFHNDEPNPRSWTTTTTKNYEATYNNYISIKNTYLEQVLPSEQVEINLFFDESVIGGFQKLITFTDGMIQLLEAGKKIRITLSGFTSPRALSDYNLALGKRRTRSVLNFFRQYKGGVFQSYLSDKQLVFSEVSYGEKNAPATVSDQLTDPQRSVFAPAAARERRVEILNILVE